MNANQGDFVGYFSVIPGSVRNDTHLTATAKLFFGDISSMAQIDGYCFASNTYFAERFGLAERTVTRTLKQLEERGHIKTQLFRDRATGKMTGRRIYPLYNPPIPEEEDAEICDVAEIEICDIADDSGEDVTFDHMTKMSSGHPTKMSSGLIMKSNNNIPPIIPQGEKRKKVTGDTEARAQLQEWVSSRFSGGNADRLVQLLMDYCDMRLELKKPLPVGTSLKAKTNKLWRLSEGRIAVMFEMVETATSNRWLDFWPLRSKAAAKPEQAPPAQKKGGYVEKWL